MTPLDTFLAESERTYTSVIPGVMDSRELADMRKLLAIVRAQDEALEYYADEEVWRDGPMGERVSRLEERRIWLDKGQVASEARAKANAIAEGK